MRAIDENGIAPLLDAFLKRVAAADGVIHVSLDVDFLDPGIAPGVGTTVPGGATFREAHLIMEILHDSGLVGSSTGRAQSFPRRARRTALLMVDLVASLMGRRVSTAQPRATATRPRSVEHPWNGRLAYVRGLLVSEHLLLSSTLERLWLSFGSKGYPQQQQRARALSPEPPPPPRPGGGAFRSALI
jgi:hypothetical protein